MKWSAFFIKIKSLCAKKTMPSLAQLLRSKNRGFIFSAVFEYVVPARYGRGVLWRLIRNRSAKYHLVWRRTPFPPSLIRVTGHSPLSEQIYVVLFCKCCMSSHVCCLLVIFVTTLTIQHRFPWAPVSLFFAVAKWQNGQQLVFSSWMHPWGHGTRRRHLTDH